MIFKNLGIYIISQIDLTFSKRKICIPSRKLYIHQSTLFKRRNSNQRTKKLKWLVSIYSFVSLQFCGDYYKEIPWRCVSTILCIYENLHFRYKTQQQLRLSAWLWYTSVCISAVLCWCTHILEMDSAEPWLTLPSIFLFYDCCFTRQWAKIGLVKSAISNWSCTICLNINVFSKRMECRKKKSKSVISAFEIINSTYTDF